MKLEKDTKIYVAGHRGMVGSAIVRHLESLSFSNIVTRTSGELDLRVLGEVRDFFREESPEVVILAAAKVGGIQANIDMPAEFIYDNLSIQNNVIHQSYLGGVKKFCFLGSSCIYPREAPQPIKEEYLLTGPLEPTNEAYAIAKIAGLKMVEYYSRQYGFPGISVMPCNLYGRNDSFDLKNSHVLSALVRRMVDGVDDGARELTVWGSGIAKREFLNADDAAEAIIYMIENYDSSEIMNVGSGTDISIKDLAELIASLAGFKGEIRWDTSKPDGMLRKCMDVSRMRELGFTPKISLEEGIKMMIEEYKVLKGEGRVPAHGGESS